MGVARDGMNKQSSYVLILYVDVGNIWDSVQLNHPSEFLNLSL